MIQPLHPVSADLAKKHPRLYKFYYIFIVTSFILMIIAFLFSIIT